MRASIRCAAVAIAVGAVAWLGFLAWRHAAWIDATARRAEAELASARPISADARVARDLLAEVDSLAVDCFGDQDAIGAPWTWQPAFDSGLRAQLQPLAAYFAAIDAACANPAVARALAGRERVDHPTNLWRSRARTNVLCAQAVLDARDGRDEQAARRLGQALDLARLDLDPHGNELLIHAALEDIVLRGVRAVTLESGAGAAFWQSRLASRLESGLDRGALVDCARGDALWFLGIEDWDALDADAGPVARWRYRDAAARRLEALESGPFVPAPRIGYWPDITAMMFQALTLQERRFGLARLALSAAAWAPDGAWAAALEGLAKCDALTMADAAAISWVVDGDEASLLVCIDDERGTVESWPLR